MIRAEAAEQAPEGIKHYSARTHDFCLCESAIDVSANYLLYEQTDKQAKVTRRSWITNIPLNARSVEAVRRAGRAKWKIESETFNTLKNHGYNFEYNYGHGKQNLATILALLMFLAFTVDQMIQRCLRVFRQVRGSLRTKAKHWDMVRSPFKVQFFPTMDTLYHQLADLYNI